ncbi:hypothetical protein NLU13_8033 [Sarocladium strictum]|uniref:AAA+ ATPase domain-containing protein n=1 Tax=Sarocladium strictum TaxID=5046 RepID=A0AA39L4L0_SARSR|nr:hypothetical protein NLU13_8033 [Sarocladium strictum]
MADLNGSAVRGSVEEQATESAIEVLSRAAALSLRLNDVVETLERRSIAAMKTLADSSQAKEHISTPCNAISVDDKAPHGDETQPNNLTAGTTASDEDLPPPRILPQVRECDWEHFVNRYSADEDLYCVDVLVANSEVDTEVDAELEKRRPMTKDGPSKVQQIDTRPVRRIASGEKWIQRVRIQSRTLLKIFSNVTGYAWGNKPHTFVRPFQYLVYFHDKLRAELEQMENNEGGQDQANDGLATSRPSLYELRVDGLGNSSSHIEAPWHTDTARSEVEGQSDAGTPSSDASTGLKELRCYLQFAEDKLLPRARMFRSENPSIRQKIRFSELWYLFKPGDFVYVPNKALRAYVEKQWGGYDPRDAKRSTNYTAWRGQNIWRVESLSLPEAKPLPVVQKTSKESIDSQLLRALDLAAANPPEEATLRLYYLGFDGSSYCSVAKEFKIETFDEEKDILELGIYPLRYHPHSGKLFRDATEQGRVFSKAVQQRHWFYDGWNFVSDPMGAFYSPSSFDPTDRSPQHIHGQVIIDFREAFNAIPMYKSDFMESDQLRGRHSFGRTSTSICPIQTWSDSKRAKLLRTIADEIVLQDDCDLQEHDDYINGDPYLKQSTRPTRIRIDREDDLALIPPWIYIYSLEQREFSAVDVCRLRPIEIHNKAFEQLQLPEAHKALIHAAVHSHLRRQHLERAIDDVKEREVASQDFIVGKGRGLLIMLHGAPGVGKTATAEAIAQQIAQPLFPVNCSDLNQYDTRMSPEKKIDEVFRLAHAWDCVLLMDEADVFLSARSSNESNNMVSIFLRKLEYYNGMLFLTTNRIGKLDAAVASRLHLILHYKRLGAPEVLNIFRNNIQRLREAEEQQSSFSNEPILFIMEDEILQFARAHCAKHPMMRGAWNGRQIRNAFVLAASLARYEASKPGLLKAGFQPQLRAKHFEQVEETNAKFWRLRKALSSWDEATRALMYEERDDHFEDEEDLADQISNKNSTGSRPSIASLLQASQSQKASPMQQQPPYGQVATGSQSSPVYPRQTFPPNYQHSPQNQLGLSRWMGSNPNPHHNLDPRAPFPDRTAMYHATVQSPFNNGGLHIPGEAIRPYHSADGGAGFTHAVPQSQQNMEVVVPYGSATGSSSGPMMAPSHTGIDADVQGNA